MTARRTRWVRLGDYIEQRREKNSSLGLPIRGVTKEGFISPKQLDADTSMYNVFYRNDFVLNPARMELNSITLNTEYSQAICSSLYEVFYVSRPSELLPEYLYLYFKREEFARYCSYDAIGSARNYFRVSNMRELRIPLPPIWVQRALVMAYAGVKRLAEENEVLIAPLAEACRALIADCKRGYPAVELGGYIEECDERNEEGGDYPFCGVNRDKAFMPTVADTTNLDPSRYKLVKQGTFAFSGMQTGRDACIRIAFQERATTILVSPSYFTFRVKGSSELLPQFLYLQFIGGESDRLGWFLSDGSIRSNLAWKRFSSIRIALPPLEVQRSIVNLYRCMEESKRIAGEARAQLEVLCSALIQRAIHS